MNLLKAEGKTVTRRRVPDEESAKIFSRVKKPQEYISEMNTFLLKKISTYVTNNPKLGVKKLSDLLILDGIFLSHNTIYKMLVKHNLNTHSLRKAWKDNRRKLKEPTL